MRNTKNNATSIINDYGNVHYYRDFLSSEKSDFLFHHFQSTIDWQQHPITLFGKTFLQPRLIAWYGDEGISYRYSQTTLTATGWTAELLAIQKMLKEDFQLDFNAVLMNLYRDGQDSMGWHSDDETSLGRQPTIASISLGTPRTMQFRQTKDHKKKTNCLLESGSLLLMEDETQHYWQHQIPKRKKITTPRINLTFRKIM